MDQFASAWLSHQDQAFFMLTAEGRLGWLNPAARNLLGAAEEFVVRDGCLTSPNRIMSAEINTFLHGVAGTSVAVVLQSGQAGRSFLLIGRRISGANGDSLIGLRIARTDTAARPVYANVAAAFGLTVAEDGIVQLLLTGNTAHDAARNLGISVETVRTHVRNIYAKLDVNSREGFFYKLHTFRVV
jgi:DNA-binding CsgD family transcriptional regulator